MAKPIKDRTPAVSPLYNNTFNTTQRDFKTDWINKDGSTAYNEDGTAKQSTIGKYNEKYGDASGNYVFIRAHDNNVQDIIAESDAQRRKLLVHFTQAGLFFGSKIGSGTYEVFVCFVQKPLLFSCQP